MRRILVRHALQIRIRNARSESEIPSLGVHDKRKRVHGFPLACGGDGKKGCEVFVVPEMVVEGFL